MPYQSLTQISCLMSILLTLVLIVIISYVYPTVATKEAVFAQQTTKSTTNFLPFVNSTYVIKLQYPSSWDK